MSAFERMGMAALHRLDPERAHDLSLRALRAGLVPLRGGPVTSDRLKVRLAGMELPNPVGLAAGYDKNARAVARLMLAGFGFVEVGAATPRPQPGNPKPRLFRLTKDRAIINRFGFNNDGAEAIVARLSARPGGIPVGLNIGANKDSPDRAADFAEVVTIAGGAADFLTVNVSSPNTERLRDLQGRDALAGVMASVLTARNRLARRPPVFVKIAPDLDSKEIADIASIALETGIDGLIATNSTISRHGLSSVLAGETGGMSGAPLFGQSTRVLAEFYRHTKGELPLIGVGGIMNADQAWEKLKAGATALQLYSSLIFSGFSLVAQIAEAIDQRLARERMSLVELVGSGHKSHI